MDTNQLKSLLKKKPEECVNRLQSLRRPRDLSLGGTKPKKAFVPNINVTRNKDKSKELIKNNLDKKRKERVKNETRNRNSDHGQRFVQSSGIFSEGTVEQRKSIIHRERSSYGSSRSENEPSSIEVPTYKKEKFTVDKEKEDVILDELMNHDEGTDDEKMHLTPVMWNNVENNITPIVKTEKLNGSSLEVDSGRIHQYFHKMEESDDNCKLALVKLPDSLAGKGLSDDPNVKEIFDYPLNVMLEGKIGTLQIKRSGKMFMKIGHVKYLLEPTDFFSSNEAVASYSEAQGHNEKPDFALLGNIEQRFVINPIWKYLLKS